MFHQADEASRQVPGRKAEAMNLKDGSTVGCRAVLVAAEVPIRSVRPAIARGLSRQHES
jgi:hypothetical protein